MVYAAEVHFSVVRMLVRIYLMGIWRRLHNSALDEVTKFENLKMQQHSVLVCCGPVSCRILCLVCTGLGITFVCSHAAACRHAAAPSLANGFLDISSRGTTTPLYKCVRHRSPSSSAETVVRAAKIYRCVVTGTLSSGVTPAGCCLHAHSSK